MNVWVTTDTHLGHDAMVEYCGRPKNHSYLILKRHSEMVKPDDILIHLGDICIGNDALWHSNFMGCVPGRKWLVRGNHDKKSDTWYLSHGWDFVGYNILLRKFGIDILLSHIPVGGNGYDVNVHGHFHNSDHRRHEPELSAIKTDRHILVAIENTNLMPVILRRVVGK